MRSTLFFIPHAIGPLPVMGLGWLLLLLVVAALIWSWRSKQQTGDWSVALEGLPVWLIAGVLVAVVFPWIEVRTAEGTPIGLPVRGYGVLMMVGAVCGVGLVFRRCQQVGVTKDEILSLTFWSFAGGIIGARIFHVIQYWESFAPDGTLGEKLMAAMKFTEGGLVVYGGIIVGLMTVFIWCALRGKPLLTIADLVVPGFLIGLGFGRLGCFMNGCCYGGICEGELPAVTFPTGSGTTRCPVYEDQLVSGRLLGMEYDTTDPKAMARPVRRVVPHSWAAAHGIVEGDIIESLEYDFIPPPIDRDPAGPPEVRIMLKIVGKPLLVGATPTLPARSRPVHPAQLYSSINAFLLCFALYQLWPIVRKNGVVLATGLILYGVSRIIEEIIRTDEVGQFGTSLTISQWISVLGMVCGVLILASWKKLGERQMVV